MSDLSSAAAAHIDVPGDKRDRIARRLLAWYRLHKRDLPWRGGSAYAVWVSEIMLQQTQVATVIPFFERFMARFPTVESLAAAPVDDVLREWAGLGYYARARNLHRAAQQVVAEHGGRVPDTPADIEALPGIGRYTAGAILSIAYDVPRPLVDANVVRVLSRVFGVRGDPKSTATQAALWSIADQLVPPESPGDFNQGLMELGALVCRPDEPLCEQCPLLAECFAGGTADPTALPETPAGRAVVRVTHSSAIVLSGGDGPGEPAGAPDSGARVLLVQRPLHGLWGGLWEFPRAVCGPGEAPPEAAARAAREAAGIEIAVSGPLAVIKHSVTYHRITLHGCLATPAGGAAAPVGGAARWVPVTELAGYALSAPQALLREALERRLGSTGEASGQGSLEL